MQTAQRCSATRAWPDAGPGSAGQRAAKATQKERARDSLARRPPARIMPSGRTRDGVTTLPPHPLHRGAAVNDALTARVTRYARCAESGLDPDQWFPVSVHPARARQEAAAAIAVCTSCLVRSEFLVLSLQHWDVGERGCGAGWSQPTARDCDAGCLAAPAAAAGLPRLE